MSLAVQIGILLAVATAFTSVVGFLYKHRGAVAAAPVEFRRPVRSSLVLLRSPWYTLGILIAMGSWGFHVAALSLAPISLVQSVIAGGLVLLTVAADRLFAHHVTRREWVGVALAAAGLAFLAATLDEGGSGAYADYETGVLLPYVGLTAVAAVAVAAFARRSAHNGVLLGASAGLFWAASDVSIKAISQGIDAGPEVVLHPLSAVVALASFAGMVVSARSLQLGKAVPVIAVTSVAANLVTIAAGPAVFEEPLPDDALGLTIRLLAFALVICAAALTPAPVRAIQPEPV